MKSIRQRSLFALLSGGSILVSVGSAVLWHVISNERRTDFDHRLVVEGQALASLLSVSAEGLSFDFADENLPQFSRADDPEYFEIRLRDGSLVERSDSLRDATLGPEALPASTPILTDVILPSGAAGRRVSLLVAPLRRESDERREVREHEDETVGPANATAYLSVACSRVPLDRFLGRLRWGLLAWAALMLLGTSVLSVAAVTWGLRPVQRAARDVETLDVGTLSHRLAEQRAPSELRPFVERVNGLLARLEQSFQREQDFSANVAHELRTPLAELRTLCDVARGAPDDSRLRVTFFDDARAVGLAMERLVEMLSNLRAVETGASPALGSAVPVRLRAAIEQSWEPLVSMAETRGLEFRLECDAEVAIATEPEQLLMILSNLLSNAAQYTPPGSWVAVCARSDGGAVMSVVVSNPAPDLSAAEVPRLFERFWRKTAAREADGHLGLGLPLAAALARSLGLVLEAALTTGGVLELTLRSGS